MNKYKVVDDLGFFYTNKTKTHDYKSFKVSEYDGHKGCYQSLGHAKLIAKGLLNKYSTIITHIEVWNLRKYQYSINNIGGRWERIKV
jgi:hypothetical protein